MRRYLVAIWLIVCLAGQDAISQQLNPRGHFLTDTIKIGEEFAYSLSVTYPSELDIVFPDSTFTYGSFDLERKVPFPTLTIGENSRDSAVYYFSSFEIDSVQRLNLPVYLLTGNDSTAYFPGEDMVILEHVVTQIPDSVAMIDNTIYRSVEYQFNYPYFLIGLGLFILLLVLVVLFFGKRIRSRYRSYILSRRHKKFLEAFNNMAGQDDAEPVIAYWKRYMEKLEKIPYTRMTTREILAGSEFEDLEKPLRTIDKVIYGSRVDPKLDVTWADLREFSNQRYIETINQLRNG